MRHKAVLTGAVPLVVLFATLTLTIGLAQAGVCTSDIPMGAIAPARPIWCEALGAGRDTHVAGANSWSDDFNHGQSMAQLNPAYVEGFFGNGDVRHFQHNDHWMVDIESHGHNALIGAWMRPNRSFRLQADGSLVVEFEVAGPIAGTRELDNDQRLVARARAVDGARAARHAVVGLGPAPQRHLSVRGFPWLLDVRLPHAAEPPSHLRAVPRRLRHGRHEAESACGRSTRTAARCGSSSAAIPAA